MRKFVAVVLLLLVAAACSKSAEKPKATASAVPTASLRPKVSRPPVSAGSVNRPVAGVYVSTLTSLKGPALPSGMERIETITSSGKDVFQSIIGTNKNSNQVIYQRKWSATGVTLLSSDALANGGERKCEYQPPINLFPLPLKDGALEEQHWSDANLACSGTTQITVLGQDTTTDARGKKWSVWKIEEKTNSGGDSTQLHWFSPELGVDIRDQSTSPAQTTLSILRDYP